MLSLAHLNVGNTKQAEKIAAISWLDQKFDEKIFQHHIKQNISIVGLSTLK